MVSCESGGAVQGWSAIAMVFQSWATTGRSPRAMTKAASVSACERSTSSPPAQAATVSGPLTAASPKSKEAWPRRVAEGLLQPLGRGAQLELAEGGPQRRAVGLARRDPVEVDVGLDFPVGRGEP